MKFFVFLCIFFFVFKETSQCVLLTPLIRFGRSIEEFPNDEIPRAEHHRRHRHRHPHHRHPHRHTKAPNSEKRDTCRKGYCCEEEQCVKC